MERCIDSRINVLFTMISYSDQMVGKFYAAARLLVCAMAILALSAVFGHDEVRAQTADIDWADAGVTSQGSLPSGMTATGSDGTVATVTWSSQTQGNGSFVPAFAPTFVSYFSGTIGSGVSPLLLSFDNSSYDPRDKITVTITLNRAVTNLRFAINDIDNGNFADAIGVSYDNDLTGAFTNAATNTSFWSTGSAVTRTNDATVNGWRGTANSANNSVNGDIQFNFGSQQVQRIQIVYFSYTGTGDPGVQFATVSDLTFAALSADLSLTKQLIASPVSDGGTATWRLTLTNASASTTSANGVVVRDNIPAEFAFENASGDGSFDGANGLWSVGTLVPGQSASIDITGTINSSGGSTVTNTAEIIASSAADFDSTPDNGVTGEDDFASSSLTVPDFTSNPPILSCTVGATVFDWDSPSVSWTGGDTSNSYPLDSFGDIEFDITGDANFAERASFGGAVPALTSAVSGGLSPTELALAYNADNSSRDQQFVTTITLPRVFTGVQFTIFDVDSSSGFQDRITAYGELNGVRVNAIMTEGPANTASGDTIVGLGGAGDTTAAGDAIVSFLQPIDTIVFEYGNGPAAPANPTNQSIALHDITLCIPEEPVISVSKVSSIIADPVNGSINPKAIPGATVEYLITITNTGLGTPDTGTVIIWDDGPADAKMCLIARTGGPVIFDDPGNNSGLTYDYGGTGSVTGDLAISTDDLEFSDNNGLDFDHTPSDDGEGCDTAITDFRVRPGGTLASGEAVTITVRYQIE